MNADEFIQVSCMLPHPTCIDEFFLLGIRKNFRLTHQCITLIQEINTIFTDRLLTCHVFRKVHPTLGSEFLTAYHEVLQILRMKRHNLKVALKTFLNAHSFYSVDEFFTCTDGMYC
jgi:hypothetical protein